MVRQHLAHCVERDNQCYSQYHYSFSCWVQSVSIPNPAQLQFSINNILMALYFHQELLHANWQQFFSNWNSVQYQCNHFNDKSKYSGRGNDFALDDISLQPVSIKRDSVK